MTEQTAALSFELWVLQKKKKKATNIEE